LGVIGVGAKIPLAVQLFDGDEGKFVKATMRDDTDAEITGSPKTLTHVGEGLYTNNTVDMPNVPYVNAIYEIFNNVGLSVESEEHSDAKSQYTTADIESTVTIGINQVLGRGEVIAEVQQDQVLDVTIEQDQVLDAQLVDNDNLDIEQESSELDVKLEEGDNIDVESDC